MKKTILAGLSCLLASTPAWANPTIFSDEIIVTAARVPQSRGSVLSDVTIIDHEEIERAGQSSLIELLQGQSGVEISSNGGAGKSSYVYLRGTNADHIVLLVDGLRINSATLGTTSFENLPLGQIERIEILRGPASSLYGADAIGGVIQIFTKRGEGKPKLTAYAGYGSYSTRRMEAGVSGSTDDHATRYALDLSGLETNGFSAKKVSTGLDADNDPYRNLSVSASLIQRLAEGHELEAQFFQSKGINHYDCNKSVCEIDGTLRSYGLTSRNRFLPFWNSTVRLGLGIDDSGDQAGTSFTSFRTEQRQYTWQNDLALPLGTLTLAYDRLDQAVSGTTQFTAKSRVNDGWLASYLADIGAHSMQASLRRDDNTQFGSHDTVALAYGYRITPQWRASASYGTAFKAPTFNQLYSPLSLTLTGFQGNPALKPETSRNSEASLQYMTDVLQAKLTVFDNAIKNLVELSGAPSGFNPVNVPGAEIIGATIEGSMQMATRWTLAGNLTAQSPKNDSTDKLLIKRGQRHGTFNIAYQAGPFQARAEVIGTSIRFNDAANSKRMNGYALVNLTANYALHEDWQLEARANNVLDKNYVLAYSGNLATSAPYETAGANLFVGLRWQPK